MPQHAALNIELKSILTRITRGTPTERHDTCIVNQCVKPYIYDMYSESIINEETMLPD